jgi:hypothetical protein
MPPASGGRGQRPSARHPTLSVCSPAEDVADVSGPAGDANAVYVLTERGDAIESSGSMSFAHARTTYGEKRVFVRGDFGVPFRCVSPAMYGFLLSAATRFAAPASSLLPRQLGTANVDPERPLPLLLQVGALFGVLNTRFGDQFPLANVLLRSPAFLCLEAPVLETPGYSPLPPYLLVLASAVRWHEAAPSYANIPWLLTLGWWAAENRHPRTGGPLPFHKLLVAPMFAIASNKTARLTRVKYFWAVADVVIALIRRYLSKHIDAFHSRQRLRRALVEAGDYERVAVTRTERNLLMRDEVRYHLQPPVARLLKLKVLDGGAVEGGDADSSDDDEDDLCSAAGSNAPQVFILGDRNPRLCFGVLHYLGANYVKMHPALEALVERELGEFGLLEWRLASQRIHILNTARAVHEEEVLGPD